jgi:hypothetical protein
MGRIAVGTALSMTQTARAAEDVGICDRDYDDLGVTHEYKLRHHSGHHQDLRLNCNTHPDDIEIPEGAEVCLQTEKGVPLKHCDTGEAGR